jgi:hypothetical protein
VAFTIAKSRSGTHLGSVMSEFAVKSTESMYFPQNISKIPPVYCALFTISELSSSKLSFILAVT